MPTVHTESGDLAGLEEDGAQAFLGIPYAAPPVGEWRWQPPQPAAPWQGTFDATQFGNRSWQPPYPDVLDFGEIPGQLSEDCLYLNIFTPNSDGARRPVLFWIHGGAYMQGSANEYDGSTLARDNDVVVVAINYRLGIFGFCNLAALGEEFERSASAGFQDQIAALRWVRANIAAFGGNPDNITICGESAGGGSVLALIGSPSANGLYHKAIAFSAAEPVGAPPDAVAPLCAHFGCEADGLAKHLKDATAESLFEAQLAGAFNTAAGVDGIVVTQAPVDAIRGQGRSGVPLIAGCTKDEGTFLGPLVATSEEAATGFIQFCAISIGNGDPTRYLAWLDSALADASPMQRLERAWYDLFRASTLRAAQAATEAGVGGWVYNFEPPTKNPLGATHASDIPFTFNSFKTGGGLGFHDGNDPAIRELAEQWSTTMANFARTGNPNGAGLPHWPQYDATTRQCLIVATPSSIAEDPDGSELRAAYGI